jgi:hypothetical protein
MRSSLATVAFLLAATVVFSLSAEAQQRGGMHQQAPRYDKATEVTVHGTVAEVKQVDNAMGMHKVPGTHVVLETEQETIEVHLGPSTFLAGQQLSLQSGDTLQIVGSRVKVAGAEAIIAREVRKGDRTITLRDAQGFPKWSRRPQS